MCAPSEKFLHMGGPLAIGLGIVFASTVGKWKNKMLWWGGGGGGGGLCIMIVVKDSTFHGVMLLQLEDIYI